MFDYIHLRSESPKRRAYLCREFFHLIYQTAFPHPDQTESPDKWLPLMGEHVPDGQPHVHIILACDSHQAILGGVVFEFLMTSECWLMTYIAVRPDMRRHGIAGGLMQEVVRFIGTHCGAALLFAEAENPTCLVGCSDQLVALRRLQTLDGFGLRYLPFDYVQPALAANKQVLHDLFLLCYAPDDQPPYEQIAANRIIGFLTELYAGLNQAGSEHLQHMCSDLANVGVVQVERLISARQN